MKKNTLEEVSFLCFPSSVVQTKLRLSSIVSTKYKYILLQNVFGSSYSKIFPLSQLFNPGSDNFCVLGSLTFHNNPYLLPLNSRDSATAFAF